MNFNWQRLLPDRDFQFPMGLRPGDARQFFQHIDPTGAMLRERAKWLAETPELYAGILTNGEDALREFARWLSADVSGIDNSMQLCVALGKICEPDWVLVKADSAGVFRMVGGVVCFPSAWDLREKMGAPIEEIHGPVPGLNTVLAPQIHHFLQHIKPGASWERENWGLSADTEFNRHPSLNRARVTSEATLSQTQLRIETQVLFKLTESGAILFGIRVWHVPLSDIAKQPDAAARLRRALETMPEPVAIYKGVAAARASLIRQLRGA